MTTIQRSALLPYPADKLFALVNDIESYPHYMEGCVKAEILRRDEALVEARLHLARAGIAHSFATRNRNHGDHMIELELLDGPFETFNGRWQFQPLGETACKVSLDLNFTLSNSILGAADGRLLDSITANMLEAVTRRARELYG